MTENVVRKPRVDGNWKMNQVNLDTYFVGQGLLLCDLKMGHLGEDGLVSLIGDVKDVGIFIAPSFTQLPKAQEYLECKNVPKNLELGAQDMYFEKEGAFTGEISAKMLKDVGVKYVILGHSERRHVIGETDELINKKILAALEAGLYPVLCVGELIEQRKTGKTEEVVMQQLYNGLAGVTKEQMNRVTIAYEPVWAIGTGLTATPQQAQEVHSDIRELIEKKFDRITAINTIIEYGGSVKPANAAELIAQPDVDGFLVGGASLKAKDFAAIIKEAAMWYRNKTDGK